MLEAIGLSVTFALLGLRTTGNGDEVAEDSHAGCKYGGSKTTPEEGCFIYKWHYIFQYIPVSVTIVSLLLNAIVACPKRFFKRHVLRSNCWKEWLFALILVLWIIEAMLDQFYFDAWKMEAMGLFLGTYATGMATWGIFKAYKRVFCGRFYQSTANYMYSLWTSRSRIGLFYIPAGMFVFSIIMTAIAAITGLTGLEINILDPTWDPFIVTQAIGYLAYEAWLLWGMCRNCNNVKTSDIAEELESMAEPREGRLRPLLPSVNLLLGWAHTKALYCFKGLCESGLVFPYIKRTGNGWVYLPSFAMYACAWLLTSVCSAASNRKGLAFWAVAKYLLDDVAYCLWMLIYATMEGSIK